MQGIMLKLFLVYQFTAGRRDGEHELHARRDRLHQLRGL